MGDVANGMRLDRFLARCVPSVSRAHLQRIIDAGGVRVDGVVTRKASTRLAAGSRVAVIAMDLPREGPSPEPIELDLLYEDEWIAVVNKPAGMVVHPGRGHGSGTLAAALAYRFAELSQVGGAARPGIVHRLDRDTSGVILVAKSDHIHHHLSDQFRARTVEKRYLAIVSGHPDLDRDVITKPIGIHPTHREKMAIREGHSTSRHAETRYEVQHRWGRFAVIEAQPKTGRTHQIRVHLASIGCPVLCDKLYGGRAQISQAELAGRPIDPTAPPLLERQALHARQLSCVHPHTGERLEFTAPVPPDIQRVLDVLQG